MRFCSDRAISPLISDSDTEHPEVLEAISTGVAAGLETSKLAGMSTADAGFAKKWFDKGCSRVSIGSDLQLLMRSPTTAGALALRPEEFHKP
jgi:2-keto-3-deoxy-L-rhamnonate aldolase RhmA